MTGNSVFYLWNHALQKAGYVGSCVCDQINHYGSGRAVFHNALAFCDVWRRLFCNFSDESIKKFNFTPN